MKLHELTLWLGAGLSMPLPSAKPGFAAVRNACADAAGLQVSRWDDDDPRWCLLNNVLPEVFLSRLSDAGLQLSEAMAALYGGGLPNAGHHAAARVLMAGGRVVTTNWDTLIEEAFLQSDGKPLSSTPMSRNFVKLHGTASDPGSLQFLTRQVTRPLPDKEMRRLVEMAANQVVVVAGYGGADVDLYPALRKSIAAAKGCLWLAGLEGQRQETSHEAKYVMWRYQLQGVTYALPTDYSRRYLVWSGVGSSLTSPSDSLIRLVGLNPQPQTVPPFNQAMGMVERHLKELSTKSAIRRRIYPEAVLAERLGIRATAVRRYALALAIAPWAARRASFRALGNSLVTRGGILRRPATAIKRLLSRRGKANELATRSTVGAKPVDAADVGDRILSGETPASIDESLGVASQVLWTGSLNMVIRLAQMQLNRALATDLSTADTDWPERVSRAAFVLGQAYGWQGRIFALEEVCRSGLMRIVGGKWIAWELLLRANAAMARSNYADAVEFCQEADKLMQLEGIQAWATTAVSTRAHALLGQGEVGKAAALMRKAKNMRTIGEGSTSLILLQGAEVSFASGEKQSALQMWRKLYDTHYPTLSGVALMRSAETLASVELLRRAVEKFRLADCLWGLYRCQVQLGAPKVDAEDALLPIYQPHGPWTL